MSKENTQFAILGLLTIGCQTGYSIKQTMDGSLNHFWKISYGQIYPTLKKLVDNGYASVQDTSQEGKPDKKEYHITEKGKIALKEWLQDPILDLATDKNELLLKLFFSRHQDSSQTLDLLDSYKEKLTTRHDTFQAISKRINENHIQDADAPYWLMTLDYGLCTTKAAIDWCEQTKIKLLSKER
ncbi:MULTISPECIES: PadR family transcriptional regulator [unclassified Sutcliffiella]|uniref:PadR family transcriptional regulator n=1 Tax=unclassified Sutcliffiella TaxID=2837532 RepID=UPI0030CF6FAC